MSALPCVTNSRPEQTVFALKGATGGGIGAISSLTVSSLLVESSEIGLGNNQYISSIGGQLFFFDGTTLEPISALSSVSTIEDWSFYPAISTVNLAGENLIGGNVIAGTQVSTNVGFISSLYTQEQQGGTGFISSLSATTLNATSTITNDLNVSGNITAQSIVANDISTFSLTAISTIHSISSISSSQLAAEAINTSSINGVDISTIIGGAVDVDLVVSTLTAANFISTPDIECSTINGATFGTSSITVDVVGVSTLAANSISTLGAVMRDALVSTLQFNPSLGGVSLGGVNLGLGSILGNVIGWGAGVMGAATGTVGMITGTAALMMGRPGNNINTANFEMINGTSQIQFSTLGDPTTSIFRAVNSTGDPSQVPGEEVFISTIIPAGAHCIRTVSDPINTMSSPNSTVQAFGEWEEIPYILPSSISTVADWAEYPAVSTIQFGTGVQGIILNPNTGGLLDLRSDNGVNIRPQVGTGYVDLVARGVTATGTVNALSTVVLGNNSIYLDAQALPSTVSVYKFPPGSGLGQVLTSALLLDAGGLSQTALFYNTGNNHVQALQGSIGGAISTIAYQSDFTPNFSTGTVDANQGKFNTISSGAIASGTATTSLEVVSTISTGVIQGSALDMFGIPGYNGGLNIIASTLALTSTPLVVHTGNYNGSTCSFFQANIRDVVASTVTTSTLNVNTIPTATFSTLRFAQQAAYGLSSLVGLSTAGTTSGTSTIMTINTDLSIGTNDLFCGQVRIFAGSNINTAEIAMTGPDGYFQTIDRANADITLRTRSGLNSQVSTGYFLDTFHNKPFFSTINQSTAMMAYFPSTNASTIGFSTLSIIPPLVAYGSWYSSTSQTVIGANTLTPLTYNSEAMNIGGFSFAGSTITVPVAGNYKITHSIQFDTASGGANNVYFWPKKNGTDIPQTNSIVTVVNNGETLGTIEVFTNAAAGDQFAVCINAPADANMTASALNPAVGPRVPSIITNIQKL
jgi:hypothetical protein